MKGWSRGGMRCAKEKFNWGVFKGIMNVLFGFDVYVGE